MTTVGTKYQIVVERAAREALGIAPGWKAVQSVVGDHLEVYFVPPEHNRSLAGRLRKYAHPEEPEPAAEKQHGWQVHVDERWRRE